MSLNKLTSLAREKDYLKIRAESIKTDNMNVREIFIIGDDEEESYNFPTDQAQENQVLRADASKNLIFVDDLTTAETNIQNNTDAITGISSDYLKRDGSLAMTGDLNLDSNNITNIQDLSCVNLSVIGTTSSNLNVENNFITINDGETGSGVSAGNAGIIVDRGTATNYEMRFNEATGLFQVGEIGQQVPLACIEEVPQDTGYTYYDSATSCLKTVVQIPADRVGNGDVDDIKLSYLQNTSSDVLGFEDIGEFLNKDINADTNNITNISDGNIKVGASIDAQKISSGVVSNAEYEQLNGVSSLLLGRDDVGELKNKTINADLNTLTNIANSQIKVGASIDCQKLSSGSITNTEFNYLSGVDSSILGNSQTGVFTNKEIDANLNTLIDVCRLSQNQTITGIKTFNSKIDMNTNLIDNANRINFTSGVDNVNKITIPNGLLQSWRIATSTLSYLTVDTLNEEVKMNKELNVNLQDLTGISEMTFHTAGSKKIKLNASDTTALTIGESLDDYITFNTQEKSMQIKQDICVQKSKSALALASSIITNTMALTTGNEVPVNINLPIGNNLSNFTRTNNDEFTYTGSKAKTFIMTYNLSLDTQAGKATIKTRWKRNNGVNPNQASVCRGYTDKDGKGRLFSNTRLITMNQNENIRLYITSEDANDTVNIYSYNVSIIESLLCV